MSETTLVLKSNMVAQVRLRPRLPSFPSGLALTQLLEMSLSLKAPHLNNNVNTTRIIDDNVQRDTMAQDSIARMRGQALEASAYARGKSAKGR